jgi:hypothetical protein
MRPVASEGDYFAAYLKYQTEQLTKFTKGLDSSNPYARARNVNNIRQTASLAAKLQRQASEFGRQSEELRRTLAANQKAVAAAQTELQRVQLAQQSEQKRLSNRDNLSSYFEAQSNTVATDLVNEQTPNFVAPDVDQEVDKKITDEESRAGGQIDREWLEANKLSTMDLKEADKPQSSDSRVQIEGKLKKGLDTSNYRFSLPGDDRGQAEDAPLAEPQGPSTSQRGGESKVERFEQQLQVRQQQQVQQPQAASQPTSGSGSRPTRSRGTSSRIESQDGDFSQQGTAFDIDATLGDMETQFGAFDANNMAAGIGGGGFAGHALGEAPPPNYGQLGLSSLDVAFPQRGQEVRFTTPRGDIEISAHAVDHSLWFRFTRLLAVVAMFAAALGSLYICRSLASHFRPGPLWVGLLILGGLIAGILGYAALCLVLILLGLIVLVRWLWNRTFVAASAG